jgi:hypothetical protein
MPRLAGTASTNVDISAIDKVKKSFFIFLLGLFSLQM